MESIDIIKKLKNTIKQLKLINSTSLALSQERTIEIKEKESVILTKIVKCFNEILSDNIINNNNQISKTSEKKSNYWSIISKHLNSPLVRFCIINEEIEINNKQGENFLEKGENRHDGKNRHKGDRHLNPRSRKGAHGGRHPGVGGAGRQILDVGNHLVQQVLNVVKFLVPGNVIQAVGPVIPVSQAGKGADGDQNRFAHGQHDFGENLQMVRAVDLRRFIDRVGNTVGEIGPDHHHVPAAQQQVRDQLCENRILDSKGV